MQMRSREQPAVVEEVLKKLGGKARNRKIYRMVRQIREERGEDSSTEDLKDTDRKGGVREVLQRHSLSPHHEKRFPGAEILFIKLDGVNGHSERSKMLTTKNWQI
jgi:hypothetical protein